MGASQCGKTTLEAWLLRGLDNFVIIDTAHREQWDGGLPVVEDPAQLLRLSRCVWRPPLRSISQPARDESDPWSLGLRHLWEFRGAPGGGGVLLVVDELMVACPPKPHRILEEVVIQGMGRRVGVWGCTQTPWRVYSPLMSNAMVRVLFQLHSRAARGAVGADLDAVETEMRLTQLQRWEWLYWRQGMPAPSGPHNLRRLGKPTRTGNSAGEPPLQPDASEGIEAV